MNTKIENLNGEEWRTIPGYENYMVSNLGRVKRLNRGLKRVHPRNVKIDVEYVLHEKLLNPSIESIGYLHVCLVKAQGAKGRFFKVHQLVAASFLGWELGSSSNVCDRHAYVIDHVNGDRQDNRVENLRIVSKAINSQRKVKQKRFVDFAEGEWKKIVEDGMRSGYRISSEGVVANWAHCVVGDINNRTSIRTYTLF